MEGASLLPVLTKKEKLKERSIFWHLPHHRKEGLSMTAAIRKGKWKCIVEFETDNVYLFNLEEDFSESKNLVDVYPEKVKSLSKELIAWQTKVDAKMPALNLNYKE